MTCPGCGKEMDHESGDPIRTLASIGVHDLFCAPPGVLDMLMYYSDETITPTLGRWVGLSIEKMVRSLA